MVITFSHDTAFSQLDEYGYVVTFRKQRRKRPNCKTWMNRKRGGEKVADVRISELGWIQLHGDRLREFVGPSGFDGVGQWQSAIVEFNDGELPDDGYLYMVTMDAKSIRHTRFQANATTFKD